VIEWYPVRSWWEGGVGVSSCNPPNPRIKNSIEKIYKLALPSVEDMALPSIVLPLNYHCCNIVQKLILFDPILQHHRHAMFP